MDVDTEGKPGQFEESNWLKITNLDPQVTDKQLAEHILEKSKKKPKFLEIYSHSKGEHPSFAIVRMKTLKSAETVIEKLRMSKLKGQKMRIQKCGEISHSRCESHKGATREVMLCHLPADIEKEEIKKMCSGPRARVKKVWFNVDKQGYRLRTALVTMSSEEAANSVFDGLHLKKVKGCKIKTSFSMKQSGPKTCFIGWFPKSVSQKDIRKFVSGAVDERPLHIRLEDSQRDSDQAAFVKFSNFGLAAQCISKLNGKELGGVEVEVKTARSRSQRDGALKKVTTKKKLKGSSFSGKKKMEKSKNRLAAAKGKGKGKKSGFGKIKK